MYVHMYMHICIVYCGQVVITVLRWNTICTASETTSSIGVQLKYLKGMPSGTARVEVTGYQRNGQVCMYIIYAYA